MSTNSQIAFTSLGKTIAVAATGTNNVVFTWGIIG
jgi:hypothetical protein